MGLFRGNMVSTNLCYANLEKVCCEYRIMDYYTFDISLGQTILSNFLHGFHLPRISQVLKYCLDFQSSTYPPSLLGLNLAQLMFKVSLPENALCWLTLHVFFFLQDYGCTASWKVSRSGIRNWIRFSTLNIFVFIKIFLSKLPC